VASVAPILYVCLSSLMVRSLIHVATKKDLMDITESLELIPAHEQPVRQAGTALDRLIRLNSFDKPGLSELEFRRLFAKCRCGLVMTRQVFRCRTCVPTVPVIINLTLDDSEDSAGTTTGPIIIDLTRDSDDD
jgi:hypothetical protein